MARFLILAGLAIAILLLACCFIIGLLWVFTLGRLPGNTRQRARQRDHLFPDRHMLAVEPAAADC
jgi:hypothetical protein